MRPVLRVEYRALIKQLKYLRAVGEIAKKLGWDRLRVILVLDELSKAGLAERTDTERYKLTDEGKETLGRLEAEERLAELPEIFPKSRKSWPSVYERVPFGKRHRRGKW